MLAGLEDGCPGVAGVAAADAVGVGAPDCCWSLEAIALSLVGGKIFSPVPWSVFPRYDSGVVHEQYLKKAHRSSWPLQMKVATIQHLGPFPDGVKNDGEEKDRPHGKGRSTSDRGPSWQLI